MTPFLTTKVYYLDMKGLTDITKYKNDRHIFLTAKGSYNGYEP